MSEQRTSGGSGSSTVVALATCRALPAGDEDDGPLLVDALARRGIQAQWCVWDDPQVTWSRMRLSVIRSTWDYTGDRDGFLSWANATPRLHNPAAVLTWNSDKTYLRDLADAHLPAVPTRWLAPGDRIEWPRSEFVLKPTVGAGSVGAGRFDPNDPETPARAAAHVASLHGAGRTVMVQPYLADVDTQGEVALIYLGGRFSHAIAKQAMLAPAVVNALNAGYSRSVLFEPERISPRPPTAAELAVGERVMRFVEARFGSLVYARVDLLPTTGGPVVIEVELTEPSLFLHHEPSSADRLAAVIAERVGSS